ncbi:MAG: hypothetical protein C4531_05390 [Desulfurivibrio sp.]|nr:MAG: hypothetical protein C4531_05390 [Desulfurivibrio sp.]
MLGFLAALRKRVWAAVLSFAGAIGKIRSIAQLFLMPFHFLMPGTKRQLDNIGDIFRGLHILVNNFHGDVKVKGGICQQEMVLWQIPRTVGLNIPACRKSIASAQNQSRHKD